jgi:hypothetical protein
MALIRAQVTGPEAQDRDRARHAGGLLCVVQHFQSRCPSDGLARPGTRKTVGTSRLRDPENEPFIGLPKHFRLRPWPKT